MARLTRTEYFLRASMKVATLSATLVFITWVVGLPIRAQTTFGTIVGTIRDSADSLMSGVRVTVTNEGTNDSKQTVTDGRGGYEVTHLNPGLYTVAAEMNGFSRHVSQHVTLETGQTLQVDIGMQVGQVTESLTVTGEAPMIETETGTLSALQTGREMTELPNSPAVRGNAFSGGIYFMVGLSPGNIRFEGTSRHTFNGTRGTQGNFMLDGTQLGDQRGVQISSAQPSFETIAEMKVVGSDNSAEYPNVASVIITSKSGTNQFHGSGFEQYNSGDMNSRNFFASATPFRVYNAFGG
jgi:hypothetical protein